MDKVYDFPDRKQVEEEAAEWLIKLDGDTSLSPTQLQELRRWMHKSPAHKDELLSFGEFWSNQSLVALPITLEELYYQDPETSKRSAWGKRSSFMVIASMLLFAIAVWFKGSWFDRHSDLNSALYATAIGQQKTIDLPDGSTVFLNTNSQLQIDYSEHLRNVILLQGEAHFDVAKASDRPFRVYAGRGRVQAVGTAFTVHYRNGNDIGVTVTEGKVALGVLPQEQLEKIEISPLAAHAPSAAKHKKSSAPLGVPPASIVDELGVLEAGQMTAILVAQGDANANKLDDIQTIAEDELQRRESWRSGVLVFAGNSLQEVVSEISRYTTLSIEIVDPELNNIRIGGRFSVESPDALFDALEANFDLQVTRLGYKRVEVSSSYNKKINKL